MGFENGGFINVGDAKVVLWQATSEFFDSFKLLTADKPVAGDEDPGRPRAEESDQDPVDAA
ncbi:MAG TPA: hypothetical protein VFI31_06960 [Pirellulales bacterium]|nr:hypothetical protein [Pirellulales bacterium]